MWSHTRYRTLAIALLCESSAANFLGYSCVDVDWARSCKVSIGDVYSGSMYTESITGKSCVEGSFCKYNDDQILIQCKVSSDSEPHYEECEIPLCSDLPLCDIHLETVEQESDSFKDGAVSVSTAAQLTAAMRNHTVTEIELLRDITISEDDLNGIPIFFKPERKLVINKPGLARISCIIRDDDSMPVFFVYSGANVTIHRVTFLGDPIAGSYVQWERLGQFSLVDGEYYIRPCSTVLAYMRGMSALADIEATVTGKEADSTLEFRVLDSGVLPGGFRHVGLMLYYTKNNFGGMQRYVNTTMHCNPRLISLPSPPPTVSSPVDMLLSPAGDERPSPAGAAQEGGDKEDHALVVGCALALVACVGTLAACIAYRRLRKPATMASELGIHMSAAPSISIGEISGSEPETCCNWVQSQAEDCDQKSIPSSAKLCEEMAGVMVSVRQMAAENRTTRIRKAQDFRALATFLNRIPGTSSCPNYPSSSPFTGAAEDFNSGSRRAPDALASTRNLVTELKSGEVVNGYAYVGHLGNGTRSNVLLVQDMDTALRYTIKVIAELLRLFEPCLNPASKVDLRIAR
mmetsp:Transcript_49057/g.93755  ORF Transcript_49057/g.93755 Transcript_49057/m.93755 type:complete len:575 (-) Transcript_49057:2136-3860(-)